jgi:hypothetical protein
MNRISFSGVVAVVVSMLTAPAPGAINYGSFGSTYAENFDGLPKDAPAAANIETVYTSGWQDDTTTVAGTRVSVPGWYLYHPLSPSENGFNDHQRLRFGPGANTGSFWAFGSSATVTDMALGSLGSATVAADGTPMFIALRVTNTTGVTLTSFTVTYDGEEWRDGQSAAAESLTFDYSTTANASDWFTTGVFDAVPALNFTSPVFAGTAAAGTAVDGNTAGLTAGIKATVSGLSWAPGTDLWLRWSDNSLAGAADDGLAIDNFNFSAVPEPSGAALLGISALILTGRRRK